MQKRRTFPPSDRSSSCTWEAWPGGQGALRAWWAEEASWRLSMGLYWHLQVGVVPNP